MGTSSKVGERETQKSWSLVTWSWEWLPAILAVFCGLEACHSIQRVCELGGGDDWDQLEVPAASSASLDVVSRGASFRVALSPVGLLTVLSLSSASRW